MWDEDRVRRTPLRLSIDKLCDLVENTCGNGGTFNGLCEAVVQSTRNILRANISTPRLERALSLLFFQIHEVIAKGGI